VTLALRHPLSSGILVLAVLGILATVAVARPRYPDGVRTENVDLAQESQHSLADVKASFAEQGIALNYTSVASGVTWVGATPPPWSEVDLYAMVMPARGTVGLGHGDWENAYFEQRAGNVIVHYGGSDEATLTKVKRAIAALEPLAPRPVR